MNRKVFIVSEKADYCLGTVNQILDATEKLKSLQTAIQEMVREMIEDECFDDESISFTIELR